MSDRRVSDAQLGERLRSAREAAKLTQAAAAKQMDIARTTLLAMEQGQRQVRLPELQELSRIYGTTVNALLRDEAVFVDLVPRFRRMPNSKSEAVEHACRMLTDLARAEVELENVLGVRRTFNLPPERPLRRGGEAQQAESDAQELRNWLGLGIQPIHDIEALMELEFGIRTYVRPLDAGISGLFAYDEQLGACVLLNANHSRGRRNNSGAHEIGHLVSTRGQPDVLHDDCPERSPEEKYAKAFATCFLAPARAVRELFYEVTAGAKVLTRRHVIIMSYRLSISREALVRRLQDLGLVRPGTWDWFENNGKITKEHVEQVLGDRSEDEIDRLRRIAPTELRLANLAYEARRHELLSEGQLSSLLRLDRFTLREMLDDLEVEEDEADDAPLLHRR